LDWNGESVPPSLSSRDYDLQISRTNNATIEVIIEASGFNNSLTGALSCSNAYSKTAANEARQKWIDTYLQDGMTSFYLFIF
jgi:hypothetical protein